MDNLKELIKESYDTLPEEMQKVVADSALPEKIETVSKENGLGEEQAGILKNEVYFILLGLEPLSNFENNLEEAGIENQKINSLVEKIEGEIFSPIEGYLEEMDTIISESKESGEKEGDEDEGIEPPARQVELKKLDQINNYAEKSQPVRTKESETTTPSETATPEKPESQKGQQKEQEEQEKTEQPAEQKNSSEGIPEDIKELVASPNTLKKIKLIAHKHQLDDHRQFLEDEIMEILRGKKSPETLMTSLEKELKIPEKQAESVVVDVNEHIFKSVRDSLRKVHKQKNISQVQEEETEPAKQDTPQQSEDGMEEKKPETQTPKEKVAQPNRTVQEMLKEKTESREKQETQTKPALNETPSKEPPSEPETAPEEKEEKDPWKEIEEMKKRVEELKNKKIGDLDYGAGNEKTPDKQPKKDPWEDIEQKKMSEQKKSEKDPEYHPGTAIDDKLSKRVKLPEHTGS